MTSEKTNRPSHRAYITMVRHGAEKPEWHEIGAAWAISGGLKLRLHALPFQGEIILQEHKPKEEKASI